MIQLEKSGTHGNLKALSTDKFMTWDKSDSIDYNRGAYLELDKCVKF